MIQRLSGSKAQKRISIRYLLSIFILCAAVVTVIGLSSIWAETEGTETDSRFQNDAQTQHAQNIAIEAAFQDPEVIEAKNRDMGKDKDFALGQGKKQNNGRGAGNGGGRGGGNGGKKK